MTFQTSSIVNISKKFNETVSKELRKHGVEKISQLPNKNRREQLTLILNTINKFKVYPSNVPIKIREKLATIAILNVKEQIRLTCDESTLNKLGLGFLGFSNPENSLIFSDIDNIIGVTDTNTLDPATIAEFQKAYKKYEYLEEHGKTEAYYAFENQVHPQTENFDRSKLKHLEEPTKVKGVDVRNKAWIHNYIMVEGERLPNGNRALNNKITDKSHPHDYLARRSTQTYQYHGRTIRLPAEITVYDEFVSTTQKLMTKIKEFQKTTLKKHTQVHPAMRGENQNKVEKTRYLKMGEENQLPNHQRSKNRSIEDDTIGTAKSEYFKELHNNLRTFDKARLRKLPDDIKQDQARLENRRLGRK